MKLMDILLAEINKDKPEDQKVTRMYSTPCQICENGAHKDVKTGKFVKQH